MPNPYSTIVDTVKTGAELALEWVNAGYSILPCNSDKEPLNGERGFLVASNSPDQIKRWWLRHPEALVGVVPFSGGAVVIDVDHKEGRDGHDGLTVAGVTLDPADGFHSLSRVGKHYWYAATEEVRNVGVSDLDGMPVPLVDVRSSAGYVVAPYAPPETLPALPESVTFLESLGIYGDPATRAQFLTFIADHVGRYDDAQEATRADLLNRFIAEREQGTLNRDFMLRVQVAMIAGSVPGDATMLLLDALREVYIRPADGESIDGKWVHDWDTALMGAVGKMLNGGFKPEDSPRYQRDLDTEQLRQRVVRDAREALEREDAATSGKLLAPVSLDDEVEEGPAERIEGILFTGGKLGISAKAKAGKTTFTMNLVRSLTTGEPFLGEFETVPVQGTVGYLNYEMPKRKFQENARRMGIDLNKVRVFHGREGFNPFTHPEQWRVIAEDFKAHGVEVLILDPLSNAFPFNSQDNAGEMRRFLNLVNDLRIECGASEQIIVMHAGKGHADHSPRGSSVQEDDPDNLLYIKESAGKRKFSTKGRHDEDIPDTGLTFDPMTQLLTASMDGEHFADEVDALVELERKVLDYIKKHPGCGIGNLPGQTDAKHTAKESLLSQSLIEMRRDGRKHTFYAL
ncbi:AAA family ATPase [Nesterenkonia sp. LB17]|uniref:AAA family ATPase n=1 Tax=Nesterenkonia sp. LB17 TaxID=2901230 RepID=UPI001F4D0285|nr:AAA family ATPase [Nesterenkonia sp. LB17]MCH8564732.1 AAA family ATPase [Nesterenkonia sp. LB17]